MNSSSGQPIVRVVENERRLQTPLWFLTLGAGVLLDAMFMPVSTLLGQIGFILVDVLIMLFMLGLGLTGMLHPQWRSVLFRRRMMAAYLVGLTMCGLALLVRYYQWIEV